MKIALIGGTGNVGKVILNEALSRGHEVTAIIREGSKLDVNNKNLKVVVGDLFDVNRISKTFEGHDIILSAFGPKHGEEGTLIAATENLIKAAKNASVPRILSMGGAGSLLVGDNVRLVDTPEFPDAWKPIALAHGDALDIYRKESNLNWTNVSPAAFIEAGARTGNYRTSENNLIVNEKGESRISFEDFAVAMLDEAENPKFSKKRFTVAY